MPETKESLRLLIEIMYWLVGLKGNFPVRERWIIVAWIPFTLYRLFFLPFLF